MSCTITSSINSISDCKDGKGGIKAVYLGNFDEATSFTFGTYSTITDVTTSATFYKFVSKKNTGNWDEKVITSVTNGTTFYETTINLSFGKIEAEKRNILKTIAVARMSAIVQMFDGSFFWVGAESGVYLAEGNQTSGVMMGDANGYTIVLKAEEPESAYPVASAALTELLGL